MALIKRLAQFVADIQFQDLPHEVIAETKRILLDSIGCALAGVSSEKGKLGIKLAARIGGSGDCTVIGVGNEFSSQAAVFANGETINSLDHDPVILPPGHISPFVIPPLLALGEQQSVSGKDLILATALAHEISTRVGKALGSSRDVTEEYLKSGMTDMPPHMGYSCCILGGASGAGKILGFDQDRVSHAMSLAGHIAPVQYLNKFRKTIPIATHKYLLAGWMCQGALTAALMADTGYKGDESILEGEYGFWKFVGSRRWDPNVLVERLGRDWLFPSVTEYKLYPCCRIMHGGLDCFAHLLRENHLEPKEIEKVTAFLQPNCKQPVWLNREIQTQPDAQFSVAYNFSVAAHRIRVGPEWQDIETMHAPHILAFMDKVSLESHPNYFRAQLEDPNSRLVKIEVKARGKMFVEERRFAKGSQANASTRMSDQELIEKFRDNASFILPSHKMDNAIRCLSELESVEDITKLMDAVSI